MDEMHIKTVFTKKLIAKIVANLIKSKLGINPDINVGDIDISIGEENADIHLSLDATVKKSQIGDLVSRLM